MTKLYLGTAALFLLLLGAVAVSAQTEESPEPEPEPTIPESTTTEENMSSFPTGTTNTATASPSTSSPTNSTTTSPPTNSTTTPRPTNGTTTGLPPTTEALECDFNFTQAIGGVLVDCPPWEEDLPTYFPYPYDCTKFIECTNGFPVVHCCPEETRWDQELQTCNHQSNIECVIVTTQQTTPTTTITTTTATTTTTTEPPTTTDDPANWICPPGYEGPIMHPWNCSQFYICDSGNKPCLYDCPEPLVYNPDTQDCDWDYNVPICVGGTPPAPTTTPRSFSQKSYKTMRRFSFSLKNQISEGPCEERSPLTFY